MTVALALLLPLLLAACTQNNTPQTSTTSPAYVAEVPMQASATPQSLEATYGGKVIAAHPDSGYALMGFSQKPDSGSVQSQALFGITLETNRSIFKAGATLATMGGRRTAWAGGDVRSWAGGRRTAWAGGAYSLIPENTTAFQQIGLESAQKTATNLGAGVKIAVIDTGLDLNHAAFAGALAPASEWKDYVDGDAVPQDVGELGVGGFGHGTAVAAIALQVAPNAIILPIRVLGPDGSGNIDSVAQAIDWATAKGARIINLSLGSDERSSTVYNAILRATLAGVQVVSSAGNDNLNKITFPASDALGWGVKNFFLSVSSVDSQDNKSSFSNYSTNVRISAPGENIYTAGPGNLMVAWSGTSMSTPMVSGALALAYSLPNTNSLYSWKWATKLEEKAKGIYSSGANSMYDKQVGTKGRLDIPEFLKSGL